MATIPGSAGDGFSWVQTKTSLALSNAGNSVWCLVFDPARPKSCFHPLATVEGKVRTGRSSVASRPVVVVEIHQRLFSIREKLHEPIRWAETFGIELLLEPHGILTDTVDGMSRILDALGHEDTLGINLDTGNSWLGGGDPLQFVKTFGPRIKHVPGRTCRRACCRTAARFLAAAWA